MAEQPRFVAAEVNPFVVEYRHRVFDQLAGECAALRAAGAHLERPAERALGQPFAALAADEALHVPERIEEWDEPQTAGLKSRYQPPRALRPERTVRGRPRRRRIREPMLQIQAQRVVASGPRTLAD